MSGFLQQQTAECDASPLAARQDFHGRVGWRAAQRVHRHFETRVESQASCGVEFLLHLACRSSSADISSSLISSPNFRVDLSNSFSRSTFLHRFFDDLTHGARVVEQRLLFEIADSEPGEIYGLAVEVLSTPASMRSSDDLPDPFRPMTPIFAP
jgi:hypothetical protein